MPFGAAVELGATQFRLWAPGAREVAVVLGAHDARVQPMTALDDGWFEAQVAQATRRHALRIQYQRWHCSP